MNAIITRMMSNLEFAIYCMVSNDISNGCPSTAGHFIAEVLDFESRGGWTTEESVSFANLI